MATKMKQRNVFSEGAYQLKERAYHDTVVIGEFLYLWGGDQPGLPSVHNSVEKQKITSMLKMFHLSTGQWSTQFTNGNPPLGVMSYLCSAVNDRIYYFGGYCGHSTCYHNSLNELNVSTFTWKELQPTKSNIPVMKRANGGMISISFKAEGINCLLIVGGFGLPTCTSVFTQAQYIEIRDFKICTNEQNIFNLSTGEWIIPTVIGNCMPPTSNFIIESVSETSAIIFGGIANGIVTNDIYLIEAVTSEILQWECIKAPTGVHCTWPKGRWAHASAMINDSTLIIIGGLNHNHVLQESCWLYDIIESFWLKVALPFTEVFEHSLSSFVLKPNNVWLVLVGGGVEVYTKDFNKFKGVPSPRPTVLFELAFDHKQWCLASMFANSNNLASELALYKSKEEKGKTLCSSPVNFNSPQQNNQILQNDLSQLKEQLKEKDILIAQLTKSKSNDSSVDKCIQFDYWNITNTFEDMLTVGKKLSLFNARTKHELQLEECGLKIYIPEAVITPVESIYQVAVQCLWGGEFVFPEDTKLISGVCYISLSSSELTKPITVQLNHCADIMYESHTKYLSFVVSEYTKPPYKFELLPGGVFNVHSKYGTVSLKKMSFLIAIVEDKTLAENDLDILSTTYRGYLFSECDRFDKKLKMNLAVSQDLEYCTQVIKKQAKYLGTEESTFHFKFTGTKHSLESKDSGIVKKLKLSNLPDEKINGWKITSSKESEIINKCDVDAFSQCNTDPPYIPLIIQPDPNDKNFKDSLSYSLTLEGISENSSEIIINKSFSEIAGSKVTKVDVGIQFNYLTSYTDELDYLNDAHIIAKKMFLIEGDKPTLFSWEEYGLVIEVFEGTLPSSETAEVAVIALVGGRFVFPINSQLVSVVYAISVSKPLLQPLKLDVQHCVKLIKPPQTKCLQFVIASKSNTFFHEFATVEGGQFAINSCYGTIYRHSFSFIGIAAFTSDPNGLQHVDEEDVSTDNEDEQQHDSTDSEQDTSDEENEQQQQDIEQNEDADEQKKMNDDNVTTPDGFTARCNSFTLSDISYVGMIYYERDDLVIFTAAKKLDALLKYIEDKRPHAKVGETVHFCFDPSNGYVKLIFDDTLQRRDFTGWSIEPHSEPCQLYQRDIDKFGSTEYLAPSSCLISAYSTSSTDTVPVLHYGVQLRGIEPQVTIFIHKTTKSQEVIYSASPMSPVSPGSTQNINTETQLLDNELAKRVFRKYFADISEAITVSCTRLSVVSRLYSKEIIPLSALSDAIDNSSKTDQEKGMAVMMAILSSINTEPHLILSLIDILEAIDPVRTVASQMKHDLYHNYI